MPAGAGSNRAMVPFLANMKAVCIRAPHAATVARMALRIAPTLACILVVVFTPAHFARHEFPVFRVVLDPGHGGRSLRPISLYGDRYDSISGAYLDIYKEGAALYGIHEHAIMYAIARHAERMLAHCAPGGNFAAFRAILARYTDVEPQRIMIETSLSRPDSRNESAVRGRSDPNEQFRLFDFPGTNGTLREGRLSVINARRPHLVVSLHCATDGPPKYRGLNPVIVAPYGMLYEGLRYLKGERQTPNFFYRSAYRDWFSESSARPDIDWFIKDVSVYFTGYPPAGYPSKGSRFKGYRYNMVSWAYRDPAGWEFRAWHHPDRTPYAIKYRGFNASNAFWERERSVYERHRRDGGPEGYGGDNHYASAEIIRYVLYSLYVDAGRRSHPDERLTRPYISIWSVPLHVNAINAFVELGYLRIPHHRHMLSSRQLEIAEGIAVGVYSLLAGVTPRSSNLAQPPRGKRIDFGKYSISPSKNYFDCAAHD